VEDKTKVALFSEEKLHMGGRGNLSFGKKSFDKKCSYAQIKMRERGGQDQDGQIQVGGTKPGGRGDLHSMSAEKKLISLISLSREVREVMGSWKL
jgi:hypothetical protein